MRSLARFESYGQGLRSHRHFGKETQTNHTIMTDRCVILKGKWSLSVKNTKNTVLGYFKSIPWTQRFFRYIYFYLAPTMLSDYRILVSLKHPTKVLFYSGECVSFTSRWKGTTISSSTRIKWKAKLQIRKITHTSLKQKNRDAVQIEQYHRIQSV